MNHIGYMTIACDLASKSVNKGSGPFGAVIIHNITKEIVGRGHNLVTLEKDPTLHAEIVAIKNACRMLDTFSLDNCSLYTSCEPCPMCLSACYWARIPKIYYGNTKTDAMRIGFDDNFIYEELKKENQNRMIKMEKIEECSEYAKKSFYEWDHKEDKVCY
jgi:tRNA(Arg) A34 adenosine deaminase TadA